MKSQLRPRVLLPTAVLALLGIGVGAFAFSGTPGGDQAVPGPARPQATAPNAGAPAAPNATRADWAKQANAICARLNEQAAALTTPKNREELLAALPQALDLADAALVELRAVPAPGAHQAAIDRMQRLFAGFTKTERKAAEALANGDTLAYVELNGRAFALNDRGNEIAKRLGAKQCADGGSDGSELARALERDEIVVAVLYSPDATLDKLAIREARAGAIDVGAGFVTINAYDAREIAPVAKQVTVRSAPAVLVFARYRGAVTQIAGFADRKTVAQAADNAAI